MMFNAQHGFSPMPKKRGKKKKNKFRGREPIFWLKRKVEEKRRIRIEVAQATTSSMGKKEEKKSESDTWGAPLPPGKKKEKTRVIGINILPQREKKKGQCGHNIPLCEWGCPREKKEKCEPPASSSPSMATGQEKEKASGSTATTSSSALSPKEKKKRNKKGTPIPANHSARKRGKKRGQRPMLDPYPTQNMLRT